MVDGVKVSTFEKNKHSTTTVINNILTVVFTLTTMIY